jgi:hypothetical protein
MGLLALPVVASAETFKDVAVVDVNCSAKAAAAPDTHTRACALKYQASVFGIITGDKKFVKFDAAGNKQIVEALKASDKKDHQRVDVSSDLQGDTLKVTSVKLL